MSTRFRFAVHVVQDLFALLRILDVAREPRLHQREPDGAVVLVGEAIGVVQRYRQ